MDMACVYQWLLPVKPTFIGRDQRQRVCCIFHKVASVLYEYVVYKYSTVDFMPCE